MQRPQVCTSRGCGATKQSEKGAWCRNTISCWALDLAVSGGGGPTPVHAIRCGDCLWSMNPQVLYSKLQGERASQNQGKPASNYVPGSAVASISCFRGTFAQFLDLAFFVAIVRACMYRIFHGFERLGREGRGVQGGVVEAKNTATSIGAMSSPAFAGQRDHRNGTGTSAMRLASGVRFLARARTLCDCL